MRCAALLLLLPFPLTAQTSSRVPAPEDLGAISGHITCSDTQRPARLAEVRLVPVAVPLLPDGLRDSSANERSAGGANVVPVETDMSGAYSLRNVAPGEYYLRVDYPGYITPLIAFTRAQLAKPTPEEQQRMQQELQIVSIAAHATTQADAVIQRGGAISGTVSYDDGSPAIGVHVKLLRPNSKGEFREEYQPSRYVPPTDDQGRFREDSLPAGKYVVEADLALSEHSTSTVPSPSGQGSVQLNMTRTLFELPIYSGSALRRRDAVVVEAAAGQEVADTNLSIPLNKLHPVSGSLVAPDGHTINGGSVKLLHSDDRDQLASVDVSRDDKQFHFLYVPEDDYILSVPAAKDLTQVEVENAKGMTPPTHMEDKIVHTYGPAEQPLKVETDTTGVVVRIPEKQSAGNATTNE